MRLVPEVALVQEADVEIVMQFYENDPTTDAVLDAIAAVEPSWDRRMVALGLAVGSIAKLVRDGDLVRGPA